MAEWSIALPWKGSNWVTGSGVRIPVSPPQFIYLKSCHNHKSEINFLNVKRLFKTISKHTRNASQS